MLDNEPTGGGESGALPVSAADQSTARRAKRRTTTTTNAAPDSPRSGSKAVRAAAGGSNEPGPAAGSPGPAAPATRRRRTPAEATGSDQSGASVTNEPQPVKKARSRKAAARAPGSVDPADGSGSVVRGGEQATAGPGEPQAAGAGAARRATGAAKATRTRKVAKLGATDAAAAGIGSTDQAPSGSAPADAGPAASAAGPAVPAMQVAARAGGGVPAGQAPAKAADAPRTRKRNAPPSTAVLFLPPADVQPPAEVPARPVPAAEAAVRPAVPEAAGTNGIESVEPGPTRRRRARRAESVAEPAAVEIVAEPAESEDDDESGDRRPRRRGRRGRGRGRGTADAEETGETGETGAEEASGDGDEDAEALTRRRRRRRRRGAGGDAEAATDDGVVTVVRIREPRAGRDEVQGLTGSTRLEAKRQRRRDGREQRRTRPPILSESEFLARREAVDRHMVVRQKGDRTQVGVLEDGILVEHYVTRQSASTMVGNVYLGKVQNVLPSMEAAFVDIGRGRNAVLYAGEVNWDATGLEGRARSIEQALKSGDSVLVQVTKDPIGHKGARLTSHIALSGRHLVYVPNGNASGISRKLSDVERRRLRDVLKCMIPDGAGVIVRTAAEGATEDDLARDVKRLQAQWEDIQNKANDGGAPVLLYSEPDLVIRVVRDLFNEDFREVTIQGGDALDEVEAYLSHVSPDLVARVRRHTGSRDAFAEYRIDEQILKGLDRKVYLPSGGHLVVDRTEAMTVIDVNTGKYTGAGGNLEETVTRNNLEAAEEIVRQLRLRDLGGIVVIDFIDMVLESNRELVLRRLTECLGRDRTKHQVTEITSLGLVQMTRKRIGQGLLEAFSEVCEHCKGRGLIVHTEPVTDRPRNNVADRVKAVAAAARPDSAGADSDEYVPESLADILDEPDAGPDAAALGAGEVAGLNNGDDGDNSDERDAGGARRRARRGGTRRRTRP
jgi:ribonuclease E